MSTNVRCMRPIYERLRNHSPESAAANVLPGKRLTSHPSHLVLQALKRTELQCGLLVACKETKRQESDFSHGPVPMTWPLSIMYKILIPEVFSKYFGQDEHQVMWLDTDTVVLQDLSEMFKTPFGESQTISGVMDPFAYDQKTRHLGLSTNDTYINAGVIGFNPKLDLPSYTQSIEYWISKGYSTLFPEQDLLSGSQAGHIQLLPGQWNQFGYDTTSPDWGEFAHLPSIIHFAGSKPWKLSDSSLWHTAPNQYNSFEALYWTYRSLGGFVPEEVQDANDSSAQKKSLLYNLEPWINNEV